MSSSALCSRLARCQAAGRWASFRVVRNFSAASSDEPYVAMAPADSGPRTVWPDETMGPFGPQDQRFQLPGNVGFDCHLEGTERKIQRIPPDLLTTPSSSDRHQFILAQFINQFHGALGASRVNRAELYFLQTHTHCRITSCPELLRKDLELLFPSAPTASITVVTVTQRRSEEAAEQLLQKFVNGAKEMCFALWTAGYWADFIDPVTGAAFFASPAAEQQLEHLGFHIEVSGSCTVIRHVLHSNTVFVGTVFTNAPTDSVAIARLRGHDDDEE